MKITRLDPLVPQPPPEFTMRFSANDAWAIIAALEEFANRHPHAAHRDAWKAWAKELESELRRP